MTPDYDFYSVHQQIQKLLEYGSINESEKLIRQQHDFARQHYGESTPEYAYTVLQLGMWHDEKGEYEAAHSLMTQAVQLHQKILGTHIDTATSLFHFSILLLKMGQTQTALEKQRTAQHIYEQLNQTQSNGFAKNLAAMGWAYLAQNDAKHALSLFEQAASLQEKILGMNHHDTALSYAQAAQVYWQQGYREQALSILKTTLEITQNHLGFHHHRTLKMQLQLAFYLEQMQDSQANEMWHEGMANLKQCLGEHHPELARANYNYAYFYQRQGKNKQAIELLQSAILVLIETLGIEHAMTQKAVSELALLSLMNTAEHEFHSDSEEDEP